MIIPDEDFQSWKVYDAAGNLMADSFGDEGHYRQVLAIDEMMEEQRK